MSKIWGPSYGSQSDFYRTAVIRFILCIVLDFCRVGCQVIQQNSIVALLQYIALNVRKTGLRECFDGRLCAKACINQEDNRHYDDKGDHIQNKTLY